MKHGPIESLIPHRGLMCLLETIVDWDDLHLHCRSTTHRRPDHPLRAHDGLWAVHLCEYGAQAMAVHGGLLARREGGRARPGRLVSLRSVRVDGGRIDHLPGALDVHVEQLLGTPQSWQYAFRIAHAQNTLATGRAAVILVDGPMGGGRE